MASLSRKGKSGKAAPVMNVTPLVDVVLVLLIIFMVILPAVNSELNIELAKITNPDEENKGEPEPFLVSVDKDAVVYFENARVNREDLASHLRAANANEPNRKLALRGDRRLTYSQMRDVMAVIQDVGFPGVALRVSKSVAEEAPKLAQNLGTGKK